jgi:hypothetical protein
VLVVSALAAVVSSGVVAIASRTNPRSMVSALDRIDPSFSPGLVRSSLERARFAVTEERRVTPTIMDFGFSHAEMIGVVRVETPASVADAIWLEREARTDERRVTLRRGRNVISVWAAPRGRVSFERQASERAFTLITRE